MFESILCQVTEYDPDVLESLIELAVEIAREGREGRRVGTLFILVDEMAVLAKSRPLILDPLLGYPESSRHLTNQPPRNDQGTSGTGRWVRGQSGRNRPFRVSLPRCRGRTSECAAGTRQPPHCHG